jgi:hypothetical protein
MSRLVLSMLTLAACAGCASVQDVPQLARRSIVTVEVIVDTEPAEAKVFGEDLLCIGKAPVTKRWEIEKLEWSDGAVHFRLLPKGIRIRPGEMLSADLTAKAEGYSEETKTVRIRFSGKNDATAEKIVLKKGDGKPR